MKIYNIPSTANFVETLAQRLLDDYAQNRLKLTEVLILLPNHRACRSLAEAFVRLKGMEPTLLPQMRAIGDISEDEILFNNPDIVDEFLKLPPAISPLERTLLLMKLIIKRPQEFGIDSISLAQSCNLAQDLGNLLDTASMQGLDWSQLEKIVPLDYAAHWQDTIKFLSIITKYWPEILSERHMIDTQTRRDIIMNKQSEAWHISPPQQRIIIAGTTAVSPSMKKLVQTVANLPQGEIYLAGLDKLLDDKAWNKIDETHPQFELKELLDYLNITRDQIPNVIPSPLPERENLISELMRPASCTHMWRDSTQKLTADCTKNLYLLEPPNIRLESLSIAILIRQSLETTGNTIALVTPDRTLARRVTCQLQRWNITVDDSAGIPLAQTPWGIFMRLCACACLSEASPEKILSLVKHSLFKSREFSDQTDELSFRLDKNIFREQLDDDQAKALLDEVKNAAEDYTSIYTNFQAPLCEILEKHIKLAEELSNVSSQGEPCLWSGDDGQAGAKFIASLIDYANILDNIPVNDYLDFFETIMQGIMVRSTELSHPRIKILGPIEARLNHYDTIIIGSCNEGVWPASPSADPWMSRPMKRDFGFNQPEQQIGVMALDFSNLLGAQKVYITRSQMNDGAQCVKSRWLMRLITVLKAHKLNPTNLNSDYLLKWGQYLETPAKFIKITPPEPHPPVKYRPHKLSASAFEKLLRDPYGIFAEYILKLKPLKELNQEIGPADFGSIVHDVLNEFAIAYPEHLPNNASEILYKMGKKAFASQKIGADKIAFWFPKFYKMVDWLLQQEKEYRVQISHIYSEIWGHIYFPDTPIGQFEIYARADRIDKTNTQKYNIIDYKTGQIRKTSEVYGGYAPQLPIEALIANKGGFEGLPPAEIEQLMYWRLGDKITKFKNDLDALIESTQARILKTINLFSFEETGYLSRPNPKHLPEYSDYEHLARVKEWSVSGQGDNDD